MSDDPIHDYDISDNVLAILTPDEERRLRANAAMRAPLYLLRISVSFATIDIALEELKARARPLADIITYLPTMGGTSEDEIELDVLFASPVDAAHLRQALCVGGASLRGVPHRDY